MFKGHAGDASHFKEQTETDISLSRVCSFDAITGIVWRVRTAGNNRQGALRRHHGQRAGEYKKYSFVAFRKPSTLVSGSDPIEEILAEVKLIAREQQQQQ